MKNTNYELQGWLAVLFGVFGVLLWAGLYPLDQGVSASGFLIPQSEKITIVSPITGMITRMHPKNGDQVDVNQVLVEFDDQVLLANQRSVRQSMAGIETSNLSLAQAQKARAQQIESLRLQKDATEKLVKEGFASPNSLATFQAQLSLAESEANEMKSRIEQNSSRIKELRENADSIQKQIQQQKILSPVKGQVMNVGIKSSGINVTVGTPLMELVPDGEQLMIEARIPLDFSNQIRIGMPVEILFPTLPGSSTLHVQGVLEYISADKVVDARNNQAYIEGKVSLPDISADLRKQLRAGLPASMVVLSGKRTLLSYITRPFTERLNRGLQ